MNYTLEEGFLRILHSYSPEIDLNSGPLYGLIEYFKNPTPEAEQEIIKNIQNQLEKKVQNEGR